MKPTSTCSNWVMLRHIESYYCNLLSRAVISWHYQVAMLLRCNIVTFEVVIIIATL